MMGNDAEKFEILTIERKELTNSKIIKCSGFLDNKAVSGLNDLFRELLTDKKKNIIFDFSGVVIISQKTIDLFIDFAKKLRKRGKNLFIIKLNSNLTIRKNVRLITELDMACLSGDDDDLEEVAEGDEQLFCF